MRKLFLLLVLSFFAFGCAGLGTIKKTDQLYPGMTMAEVKQTLGRPSQTQYWGGKIVWKYSLHQYCVGWMPYYLVFDYQDKKLESWYADEQEYYQNQQLWLSVGGQLEKAKQQQQEQQQRKDEERQRKMEQIRDEAKPDGSIFKPHHIKIDKY